MDDLNNATTESNESPSEGMEEQVDANAEVSAEAQASDESNQVEDAEVKGSRSDRLQKLIDSKGGDEEKFVEGLYESWNSVSRLSKELKELRDHISSQSQKPEPQEPLDANPDYQWLKSEIGALDEELEVIGTDRQEMVGEFNLLTTELAVLQRTNGDAREIRAVQQRMAEVKKGYNKSAIEEKRVTRAKANYERQLKSAETHLLSLRDKQKQQVQVDRTEQANYRQVFDDAVMSALKDAPLSDRERLYEIVRLEATAHVEKNGMVPDLGQLGKEIASWHVARAKASQFKQVSQQKVQASAPVSQKQPVPSQQSNRPKSKGDPGKLSFKEALAKTERWAKG